MTNRRTVKKNRRPAATRPRSRLLLPLSLAAALVAVGLIALATGPGGEGSTRTAPAPSATGETNDMGLPVVTTPGSASGTASAAGVEVTGALWEMGEVPLEVAVRPAWTLVNSSRASVTLGEPHPEVRAGCCPGPFTVGDRELEPGESTTLTFELAMHPGMDGWHDIAVHVPVTTADGSEDVLNLAVTGDFRGTLS